MENDAAGRLPLVLFKPVLLCCHSVENPSTTLALLVSAGEITISRKNDFHGYIHELEKHSPQHVIWSWVRRGWNGVRRADLHDIVAEEHHLEKEGDDQVEEDDWDDEYPAHARVRLPKQSIRYYPRKVIPRRRTVWRMGYTFAQRKYPDIAKPTPVSTHLSMEEGAIQMS